MFDNTFAFETKVYEQSGLQAQPFYDSSGSLVDIYMTVAMTALREDYDAGNDDLD